MWEVTRMVLTSGQSVVRRDEVRKSAQIKLNKWGKGLGEDQEVMGNGRSEMGGG